MLLCGWSSTWWRHDMETISKSLALSEGNPPVTSHIRPVMWSIFSLLLAWSCWTNIWVVSNLSCCDAHVTSLLLSRGLESLATLTLGSSKINQHCWRFHGSGVIAAPQIIGLISFCTGMHHEYFFRSPMCFRVPHLCSKIPKINNWTGEFATIIWCLHCFTVSFGGDVRGESGPR